MKLMPLIKKMSEVPMIGIEAKSVIIVLGALLSGTAPFVHMLAPRDSPEIVQLEAKLDSGDITEAEYNSALPVLKKEQKYLGYFNFRSFLYAIGTPIAMFYFSLLMLIAVNNIQEKLLRKSMRFAFLISIYISSYLICWVIFPRSDFPDGMYHFSLGVMALATLAFSWFLIAYKNDVREKIVKLIHFISIDTYTKYIRQEDKREFMNDSYKVYDDIT